MNQGMHRTTRHTREHSRRRAATTGLVLALASALLAGCTPTEPEGTPGEENGIMHDIHASPEQSAIEEWSPRIAQEASDVATNAATVYARPELNQSQWFTGLRPYLSADAQHTFQNVSNLNITATTVTSTEEPVKGRSSAIATVTVNTNTGSLDFLLSRADGQWVVEKITSTK
ncbi:hypothetical protein ACIOTN_10760 [Glutamicibacter sp. NPDC087661]|uniref:hypothetical protein n=1 Tax=Glutamicibacter sp. NPDC087661 TaxID=3363996 RepID=UPI000FA04B76